MPLLSAYNIFLSPSARYTVPELMVPIGLKTIFLPLNVIGFFIFFDGLDGGPLTPGIKPKTTGLRSFSVLPAKL